MHVLIDNEFFKYSNLKTISSFDEALILLLIFKCNPIKCFIFEIFLSASIFFFSSKL